ncbi:MAG: DUF4271 domain-containing protein [Bacteroidales bacterium]|nr:DUF4271 domain-containing protein [Bacteroidales bacterium]
MTDSIWTTDGGVPLIFEEDIHGFIIPLPQEDSVLSASQAGHRQEFTISILDHNYLFNNQLLPEHFRERTTDWITLVLLGCLVLLAWANHFFRKKMKMVLYSLAGGRYVYQLMREGNVLRERIAVPMYLIYVFSMSLLVMQLLILSGSGLSRMSFRVFMIISLLVGLGWFVKSGVLRLSGWIFKNQAASEGFVHTIFLFNFLTGLLLIPVHLLAVYLNMKEAVYISLGLFLGLYLFRLGRQMLMGWQTTKFSLFYLFIYLCTLEILPLSVMVKVATSDSFTVS